jgi:hypothetical protein
VDSQLLTHDGAMAWGADGDLYVRRARKTSHDDTKHRPDSADSSGGYDVLRFQGKSGRLVSIHSVRAPLNAEKHLTFVVLLLVVVRMRSLIH